MTEEQVLERGKALIYMLDGEGISNEDQVPMLGGALVAALMCVPQMRRQALIVAHLEAMQHVMMIGHAA